MKKIACLIVILQLAVFGQLSAQSEGNIVVIISPELPNVNVLINEMHVDSKIAFFNGIEDPLQLITKTIKLHAPVKALHILTESKPGRILFQGREVSIDTLISHEELLGSWKQYFVDHGDILLYGCELGKGDEGLMFVQNLAILTGLDVAASKDMTGSSRLNGDWNLEVRSGPIESRLVVSRGIFDSYTTVLRGEGYGNSKKKRRALRNGVASASASRGVDR